MMIELGGKIMFQRPLAAARGPTLGAVL